MYSVHFSVIKYYGFLRNVHRFGDEVLAGMFCKNFLFRVSLPPTSPDHDT